MHIEMQLPDLVLLLCSWSDICHLQTLQKLQNLKECHHYSLADLDLKAFLHVLSVKLSLKN